MSRLSSVGRAWDCSGKNLLNQSSFEIPTVAGSNPADEIKSSLEAIYSPRGQMDKASGFYGINNDPTLYRKIVGSIPTGGLSTIGVVVTCSPSKRSPGVRFPDGANKGRCPLKLSTLY